MFLILNNQKSSSRSSTLLESLLSWMASYSFERLSSSFKIEKSLTTKTDKIAIKINFIAIFY